MDNSINSQFIIDNSNPEFIRIQYNHVWERLEDHSEILQHEIEFSRVYHEGIFQILKYTTPTNYKFAITRKMVKFVPDKFGGISIWAVDLNNIEAEEIEKNPDLLLRLPW